MTERRCYTPEEYAASRKISVRTVYRHIHAGKFGTAPEGSRGQSRLSFDTAPYEVTALNGLEIWGGVSQIMLGDRQIAARDGYTRISFIEREPFLDAVAEYHRRRRQAR